MLEHLLGDVTGDVPDGLVACTTLRQVGDQRMAIIVPSPLDTCLLCSTSTGSVGGPLSLQPKPDLSYVQTRVDFAISGSLEVILLSLSSTTVGLT